MGRIIPPKRPPGYEFSVNKLIWGRFLTGCLSTFVALIAANLWKSQKPLWFLLLLHLCMVLFLIRKKNAAKTEDIPSECYHPNLLPQNEYLTLKRQFNEAKTGVLAINNGHMFGMSDEDLKTLLKSYQDTIENIDPILNAQNELRALCLFKKDFGVIDIPAISRKFGVHVEEDDSEFDDDYSEVESDKNSSNKSTITNVDSGPIFENVNTEMEVEDVKTPETFAAPSQKSTDDKTDTPTIDNKIEQALDLVKAHVSFAVRQEAEELKAMIETLKTKVSTLEKENKNLKKCSSDQTKIFNASENVVQQQQNQTNSSSPFQSEPIGTQDGEKKAEIENLIESFEQIF